MRIVADNKIPYLKGVLEPFAEVVYLPGSEIRKVDVQHADALLVRTRTKCDASLLESSEVKFLATATIGFDHIDTAWCEQKGIRWTNATGCNSWSVHQYMASALVTLAARRKVSLAGKTLGVVGVGQVGSKIASLGKALGMKVLINDPPRERSEGPKGFTSLDELLEKSDIVTLHVPLNRSGDDKTFHMGNRAFFEKMKEGVWLINASRGEVVDGNALLGAILEGKTGAVVLDVWEHEPEINLDLLAAVDIATPHIAGYSADGKAMGTAMSVRALAGFFNLPLKDWFPKDVPLPSQNLIHLLPEWTVEQAIYESVLSTYDILQDDTRLRKQVSGFEQQRGSYPVRREFPAYQVLVPKGHKAEPVLKKIGFQCTYNQK